MRAPILAGAERVQTREAMRADYEQQRMTIPEIAAKYGRSYGNTHTLLVEADTRIRPTGSVRRGR